MITNVLNTVLAHSKETGKIIGVRKYNDGSDFYVGYIVDFNDTLIILQHISKFGLEDGLIVEKLDNIEAIETQNDYLRSYQLLFDNSGKTVAQTVKAIDTPEGENWQYELLCATFDKEKIVTIELNNEDLVTYGFILDFDEVYLSLRVIDNLGSEDGITVYKLADITSLGIDRIECRKRETLYALKTPA